MADQKGEGITWTDERLSVEACVGERDPLEQLVLHDASCPEDPLSDIPGFFRAVAGRAGWDDVSRRRLATYGHRDDVVPSRRGLVAVGAEPVEVLEDDFSSIPWNRADSTLPARASLPATVSEARASGVVGAFVLAGMRPADTRSDGACVQPILAPAAPREAHRQLESAHELRGPMGHSNVDAGSAGRSEAVVSGEVDTEFAPRNPVLTSTAPLQPCGDPAEVLLRGQSEPTRGSLACPIPASHVVQF